MAMSRSEIPDSERRAHRRVALAARAELTGGGKPERVDARDISMGGLGLAGSVGFAPGTQVHVEIEVGGQRILTPGEILVRDGGTGVRFTRLSQYALTRILHVVSRA